MDDWKLQLPEWIRKVFGLKEDTGYERHCKLARLNRRKRQAFAAEFWKAWDPIAIAGRDAYYRGDYGKADESFQALLEMADRFGLNDALANSLCFFSFRHMPRNLADSSRWWQAAILCQRPSDWNLWRRMNPTVTPDLRNQYVSNNKNLNLRGVDLSAADLSSANLVSTNLEQANLQGANLSSAYLGEANLSHGDLRGATLLDADLKWTELFGADLTDVIGLTDGQLAAALGDGNTKLPAGMEKPASWEM